MARLRYNGLVATLGGSGLTNSATSITFAAALTHSGGTNVPTITGTDFIPFTLLNSDGVPVEIVYLTAYTAAATTGTITRAQESTTGVAHTAGVSVVHAATIADLSSVTTTAKTADYTAVLADAGRVIEFDSASACVLTVPPSVFPVGTVLGAYQVGAGNVSFAQGAGVTIRNLAALSGQYAEASLRHRATNEWVLTGDLAGSQLKDYVEVIRTAGDITLNQTAVTVVHTALDIVIAADEGDLIEFGIQGIVSAVNAAPCGFDVYTMPSGSTVNPFGPGVSASMAGVQGSQGWVTGSTNNVSQLSGSVTRVMVSGDVAAGATTLRMLYAKTNTTARTLFAQTNLPLKVWAMNHGQV